jgi:secondary thiamine-phosphate synthase enzyme
MREAFGGWASLDEPFSPVASLTPVRHRASVRPMKSLTREIWMNVPARRKIVSLHRQVEDLVRESGVREGLCLVNAMHITASVFINDNEPGLHQDYERWLETLAPEKPYSQYAHNGAEDNADAHLKRQVMGREVVVAITKGALHLGPWEHIFYYEMDGNRKKRVLVKIIGD